MSKKDLDWIKKKHKEWGVPLVPLRPEDVVRWLEDHPDASPEEAKVFLAEQTKKPESVH